MPSTSAAQSVACPTAAQSLCRGRGNQPLGPPLRIRRGCSLALSRSLTDLFMVLHYSHVGNMLLWWGGSLGASGFKLRPQLSAEAPNEPPATEACCLVLRVGCAVPLVDL